VFILRLLSAIILAGLILAGIYLQGGMGKAVFTFAAVIFSFFAVMEFLDIISKTGRRSYIFSTSLLSTILVLLLIFIRPSVSRFLIIAETGVIMILFCWILILFSRQREDVMGKVINSVSAFVLVTIPLCFMVLIYLIDDVNKECNGRKLLLYLIAVTKMGDIGAYLIGVTSSKLMPGGNHKIAPSISPKKSWEGTIGGIIFSVAAAIFLIKILPLQYKFSETYAVFVGIILFIGGFTGDLAESSLKRIAGVKDSGVIIPGIGGVLDLLDSLIINAPVFYFFLLMSKA